MKKMYKELMKQIYYGEFYPDEEIMTDDPDYYTKSMELADEFEHFSEILGSNEEKMRFEMMKALMSDLHNTDRYNNFAYGFSAGLQLMSEAGQRFLGYKISEVIKDN